MNIKTMLIFLKIFAFDLFYSSHHIVIILHTLSKQGAAFINHFCILHSTFLFRKEYVSLKILAIPSDKQLSYQPG